MAEGTSSDGFDDPGGAPDLSVKIGEGGDNASRIVATVDNILATICCFELNKLISALMRPNLQ